MGDPRSEKPPLPAPREYVEALSQLQTVESQGDGVKSFMAVLISVLAAERPIVLIDEPEAFLHPPQAKLLGKYLVEETSAETQVILATHSTDLIQGVLSAEGTRDIKIIRVDGPRGYSVLSNDEIVELWQDSLLRYSRMLDGLVHQGIIVCESDADCRFYAAVLDARVGGDHDIHWTHVGGKDRLPEAAGKLRKLGLRPLVIADLDLLNDQTLVKRMMEAAGGSFDEVEADMRIVQDDIAKRANVPTVAPFKEVAIPIVKMPDAARLSDADVARISASIKRDSGWKAVKKSGVVALGSGGAQLAMHRILGALQQHGVFLVPVGEIESWEPSVGSHGPGFVTGVLGQGLHKAPSPVARTAELDLFIAQIADYVGVRKRAAEA